MKSITLSLATCLLSLLPIQAKEHGIKGNLAPEISVDEWVSLPNDEPAPTLANLKGKIVYLYCFQAWCPGCHKAGFPTLKKVSQEFKGDKEIVFIAVQTVFEGFSHNTKQDAIEIAKKYQLTNLAFGHSGSKKKQSQLMETFKTGGTPWTIIVGKDGRVKFNAFHLKPDLAIKLINRLKSDSKIK